MNEPIVRELGHRDSAADFLKLARLPRVIFLDSATPEDPLGRYSYVAAAPVEWIEAMGRRVDCFEATSADLFGSYRPTRSLEGDPFREIAERLERNPCRRIDGLPAFQGGAAGLFAYDLSRTLETIPPCRFDEFGGPDLAVGLYDWVLAYDHVEGRAYLVSTGLGRAANAGHSTDRADARARAVLELLDGADPPAAAPPTRAVARECLAPQWPLAGESRVTSDFSHDAYVRAVSAGIEHIRAGDVFQVNLSQRLLHPQTRASIDFYRRLRTANSAPFAAYFDTGERVIASSSPEQFLGVDGDQVVTRPIKGTRSRGYTPEEDVYRRADLHTSEKDRAENVMIVDLLRNDLSKVCRPGSVTVPRLFELERHPTVHHLVSEVRGRLAPGTGPVDLLRASFPGGSITGAPKVKAMEIIANLEPTARGAYCGSLGWISLAGDMNTSILIRTVTLAGGWMQLPVGGGIVADSVPEDEYRETLDKAAGMLRAL